jgi:hypothetical protein
MGHGHGKLWVQFQKCTPNWVGAMNIPDPIFPNKAQYYGIVGLFHLFGCCAESLLTQGRVYIPKLNLCLGVPVCSEILFVISPFLS